MDYSDKKFQNLPVTVLPLASVTTTVSTVVGTVAVTGLPLASKVIIFISIVFLEFKTLFGLENQHAQIALGSKINLLEMTDIC